MRQFIAVIVFTLLTVAFFAGYSNFGIPQIEAEPPPGEEKLDLGSMTMERFVVLGEKIFGGKGTCTLCHNELGRAPMLDAAARAAARRLADPRYQGKATNVEEYLTESMIRPSAYVVPGFGKKGTGDTVSPMPSASTGSARLSDAEIKAVVAYLQDSGGVEVTVEIPSQAPEDSEDDEQAGREPVKTAEEAISEFDCGTCHKVAGADGEVGPDLSGIGGRRDKAHLRKSILEPNAEITKGFEPDQMPADYGTQMYAGELEMLVDYLAGLK